MVLVLRNSETSALMLAIKSLEGPPETKDDVNEIVGSSNAVFSSTSSPEYKSDRTTAFGMAQIPKPELAKRISAPSDVDVVMSKDVEQWGTNISRICLLGFVLLAKVRIG